MFKKIWSGPGTSRFNSLTTSNPDCLMINKLGQDKICSLWFNDFRQVTINSHVFDNISVRYNATLNFRQTSSDLRHLVLFKKADFE